VTSFHADGRHFLRINVNPIMKLKDCVADALTAFVRPCRKCSPVREIIVTRRALGIVRIHARMLSK